MSALGKQCFGQRLFVTMKSAHSYQLQNPPNLQTINEEREECIYSDTIFILVKQTHFGVVDLGNLADHAQKKE